MLQQHARDVTLTQDYQDKHINTSNVSNPFRSEYTINIKTKMFQASRNCTSFRGFCCAMSETVADSLSKKWKAITVAGVESKVDISRARNYHELISEWKKEYKAKVFETREAKV